MLLSEFQSINSYLSQQPNQRNDVVVGIGDDCAVLIPPNDQQLAISMDSLVQAVHFPADTRPQDIGYKTLAVSLSDLAAMGAEPAWATLALTLPNIDEEWLKYFCQGFFQLAEQFNVQLVGGDVTQGPMVITSQLHGFVENGRALMRSGAKIGDNIYVTGRIGEAGLGLLLHQEKIENIKLDETEKHHLLDRLNRPTPRVRMGATLRDIANSAIDISDGLAADLNHILQSSGVGASIQLPALPVADCFNAVSDRVGGWQQPLGAGDDYELLFTVPQFKANVLEDTALNNQCEFTLIGKIEKQPGLRFYENDKLVKIDQLGYEHFTK